MKKNVGFWVIVTLSLALRLYALGRNNYWIDEIVSVHFASHPSWRAIFWDNNPFLYHFFLKLWILCFGNGEATTRTLSVLFSVGTTALLFRLGNKLLGRRGAVTVGLIHAFSILSILYAQETRMYAMLEFTSALSLNFFFDILQTNTGYAGFILSAPLLCLTSYLALIPMGLEVGWLAIKGKFRSFKFLWPLSLPFGASIASYLFFFSWPHLQWQKYKYSAEPASHWPGAVMWNLCDQSQVAVVGYLTLTGFFFCGLFFKAERMKKAVAPAFFVLTPLVLFQIESIVEGRSVFLPRYFIYIVPPLTLWASAVLESLVEKKWQKYLSWALLTCILLGSLLTLPRVYDFHKSPWQDAALLAGKYPQSTGLTTRTAALKTPYFERVGIDVEKWDPSTQKVDFVIERTKKFKNVWMIENYYGGLQYFDRLTARLKEKGLKVEPFVVPKGRAEPVLLLRVSAGD